jgi:hypothetical protein
MIVVRLFHGRKNPEQELNDWGTDGPFLGPFCHLHVVYGNIRLIEEDGTDHDLIQQEEMVLYQGVYYGDMIVIDYETAKAEGHKIEKFKIKKSKK